MIKSEKIQNHYQETFNNIHTLMMLLPLISFFWFTVFTLRDIWNYEVQTFGMYLVYVLGAYILHLAAILFGVFATTRVKDAASFNKWLFVMMPSYAVMTMPAFILPAVPSFLRMFS